jgi:xanthine/uracil permease
MDTTTGEVISGALAASISLSAITTPVNTQVFEALNRANAMPEWAIIAAVCGLFCIFAAFCNNCRIKTLARFLSGCVWGSIVLILGSSGELFPLFWTAVVLFSFDIYSVMLKGRLWKGRSIS